jgi:thioredoxin 1
MVILAAAMFAGCGDGNNGGGDTYGGRTPGDGDRTVADGDRTVADGQAEPTGGDVASDADGKVIYLDDSDNFQSLVLDADQPVLVDFYADWCGPCRTLAPTIEKLAGEYAGKARIVKINTDDHGQIARQYNVSGIPTVIVFDNGKGGGPIVGAQGIEVYRQALNKAVASD